MENLLFHFLPESEKNILLRTEKVESRLSENTGGKLCVRVLSCASRSFFFPFLFERLGESLNCGKLKFWKTIRSRFTTRIPDSKSAQGFVGVPITFLLLL